MKKIILLKMLIIFFSSLVYSIEDAYLVTIGKEIVRKGTTQHDQELAIQIYKQIDNSTQARTLATSINNKWPNTITAANKDNRYPKLDAEQIKRETKDVIRKYNATLITPAGISCSGI